VFRSNGYVVAVCQLSLHQTLNGGPKWIRAEQSVGTCRILLTTTSQIRQSNQHCVNNQLCASAADKASGKRYAMKQE